MKRALAGGLLLTLLLAGCATVPETGTALSPAPENAPASRARIHTQLGLAYLGRDRPAIALQELKAAIALDDRYAPAYSALALLYMRLNQTREADASFRHALALAPHDSDTQNNYGWFLCQHGRPGQSIQYFMAAVSNPLYANPAQSYANAGICMRKAKSDTAAEPYLAKALELNRRNADALFQMADIQYHQGHYTAAREYLKRYHAAAAPTAASLWLAVRTDHKLHDAQAQAADEQQLSTRFADSPQAGALRDGRYDDQ